MPPSEGTASGSVDFLVVGSPRSGTTLVQRLACEVPGVCMPPETHFFERFAGALLDRRRFPLVGTALSEELQRFAELDTSQGLELDVDALWRRMGGSCARPWDMFAAVVEALAGPATLHGEKTPGHVMWWRPISHAVASVRFVAVVRDPRAVVASNRNMPWRHDAALAAWGDNVHLAFAQLWSIVQHEVRAMQRELGPRRCLVLRYEDVVANPDATRTELARFLGRPVPAVLQEVPSGIVAPHEEWKHGALGDVTRDRVASWPSELGARRAEEVTLVCLRRLRQFGYDPRTSASGLVRATRRIGPRQTWKLLGLRRTYRGYLATIDQRRV